MYLLFFITICCLVFIGEAKARLGEDLDQLVRRYGRPTGLSESGLVTAVGFHAETYDFNFLLVEGRVEEMIVTKQRLSEKEVHTFLERNSAGTGFKKDYAKSTSSTICYTETDTGRSATWEQGNVIHQLRLKAEKNRKEKSTDERMGGF